MNTVIKAKQITHDIYIYIIHSTVSMTAWMGLAVFRFSSVGQKLQKLRKLKQFHSWFMGQY